MATLLLAEAGAEVVKIERPGIGDEMRLYAPKWGQNSVNFALLNRGKKSVAIDLKQPADRAKLSDLIARADVLVEQFRPGVMARLSLDYAAVTAINPRIVYCSITGYGQDGPKRDQAGHDLNYIGDAGLLSLSMGPAEAPVVPPALIADVAGGAYPAVINILLALEQRRHTGQGQYLDVAMADNLFPFMYWAMGAGLVTGAWPGNGTELVTGGSARYHIYLTKDGRAVAAAPIEQRFWDVFCDIIGLDAELRDDQQNPAATLRRVSSIIGSQSAPFWRRQFAGSDCCATIVANVQEALADPQFQARGVFARTLVNEQQQSLPALPVPIDSSFRGEPATALPFPALGSHNKDYLR
jgi:crotonobetainyl-CoA:carnitine CoA-transferase CaiB-like acyl-CoA transferase